MNGWTLHREEGEGWWPSATSILWCHSLEGDPGPSSGNHGAVSKAPTSPLRLILAANLRSSRKRLGISQEELGDRAHVHRTYVGAVERGEVNLPTDNIHRLAVALDVPAADLLTGPRARVPARAGAIIWERTG